MIINKNGVDYTLTAEEEAEYLANIAQIQAEKQATKYMFDRAKAYPSFADQFDTIFHEGIDAWKAQIQAVKDRFPKE